MRDYFGKSLGRTILNAASMMNPLDIARGESALKAARSGGGAGARGQSLFSDMLRSFKETAKTWDAVKQHTGKAPGLGTLASSYFKGYSMRHLAADLGVPGYARRLGKHSEARLANHLKTRGMVRTGVFGAVGLSAAAGVVMGNNSLSDALNTGIYGGAHAVGAAAMAQYGGPHGAKVGLAYAGWTGLNALRRGDNFGPF